MKDAVISLSDFKTSASRLLREIHEHPGTLVITQNGRASAVVLDYEEYYRQRQGLLMLKLMAQGEADVQGERLHEQDEVFEELRDKLTQVTDSDA